MLIRGSLDAVRRETSSTNEMGETLELSYMWRICEVKRADRMGLRGDP